MSLRKRQSIFAHNIALLIIFAYEQGYEITFGDAMSKPEYGAHRKKSLHYDRLAIDLNLFLNGQYLTRTEDHRPLGDYWKSLNPDNRWGGDFDDGNHYSMSDGKTSRR